MGTVASTIGMGQWLIDVISGGVKRNNGSGSAQNALDSEPPANATLKMPSIPA
jgi:hypothetical protein